MDSTEFLLYWLVFCTVYFLISIPVVKKYYWKKHGVPIKIINGGWNAFFSGATFLMSIWPLLLVLPRFKDPEPCRHVEHVRARAEYARLSEAYARERR